MESKPKDEPTVDELVKKALKAGVIDEEFAEDLLHSEDLEEALSMFYSYVIDKGGQPDDLLTKWGIIEPTTPPQA